MNLLSCHLGEFDTKEDVKAPKYVVSESLKNLYIDAVFIFSVVWSVGAPVDGASREKFDAELRRFVTA